MDRKNGDLELESASAAFNAQVFLDAAGRENVVEYGRGGSIFTQGNPCDSVLYLQRGRVKLSVLSKTGKEAVVAMIGPGDFFGEGCLAGQPVRMGTATAITPITIVLVGKHTMIRLLRRQRLVADRFITHLLARNIRIQADLLDQLCNSSEKRLARALLLLSRSGPQDEPVRVMPPISQETLAELVGTTRSRVNFFLSKFKKRGFIEYDGALKVHSARLSVVLEE
jgi:CRP/FNR family transcriptional regulator, cyclic AMP receptor protein